jgi:hypothetical protein
LSRPPPPESPPSTEPLATPESPKREEVDGKDVGGPKVIPLERKLLPLPVPLISGVAKVSILSSSISAEKSFHM